MPATIQPHCGGTAEPDFRGYCGAGLSKLQAGATDGKVPAPDLALNFDIRDGGVLCVPDAVLSLVFWLSRSRE